MDTFRVRLNCIDHYQGNPTQFDPRLPVLNFEDTQKSPKAPIIRVFGATESGQKVCAHIHGVFPYLYIQYTGSLVPDDVENYIRRLHASIDHALAVSYRRNLYESKTSFVAHITLVKGVPFYGFYVGYKYFLKIYVLNPLHMTRLADTLRQGSIMTQVLQPYESHMQYLAQWMCDYNLYGCAYLDVSEVNFRAPVPDFLNLESGTHKWHDKSIPASSITDRDDLVRQSHCSIEVDIQAHRIKNRLEVKSRPIHHDFVERRMPWHEEGKLVQSMKGLWQDESRRRRARMGDSDPGDSPFPPEVLVSMSADPRNSQPSGWIHEKEYLEKVHEIVTEEKIESDGRRLSFDGFVTALPFEGLIQTCFESVEDLFPERLRDLVDSRNASQIARNSSESAAEEVDVDEGRILSAEGQDLHYELDEEIAREMALSQGKRPKQSELQLQQIIDDAKGFENDDFAQESEGRERPTDDLTDEAQGPTSSKELEDIGIRDTGNYNHVVGDAFAIPAEYGDDITAATEQAGAYMKRKRNVVQQPRKKRKQFYEQPTRPDGISCEQSLDLSDPDQIIALRGLGKQVHPIEDRPTVFHSRFSNRNVDNASLLVSQETNGLEHASLDSSKSATNQKSMRLNTTQESGNLSSEERAASKPKSVSFTIPSDSLSKSSYASPCRSRNSPGDAQPPLNNLLGQVHAAFSVDQQRKLLCLQSEPPMRVDLEYEMTAEGLPPVIYQGAFYSDDKDVPERAREYAGQEFRLQSVTVPFLPSFGSADSVNWYSRDRNGIVVDRVAELRRYHVQRKSCSLFTWEIRDRPPTYQDVHEWLKDDAVTNIQDAVEEKAPNMFRKELSQIDGVTQKNRHGFKYSQRQTSTGVVFEMQYMSLMALEIHVNTRGNLLPDPEQDPIDCVFWCVQSDDVELEVNGINEGTRVGILALSETGEMAKKIAKQTAMEVEEESTELDLITHMVDIVRKYDPDILTGFEVHNGSWGYMIERARFKYDYNLCDEFSRMKSLSHGRFGKENDRWGFNHTSTIRVTGRHMINIWRAMRGELNLLQYTMENVVFHVLHRRIPHYPCQDLTAWYRSDRPRDLARAIDYYVSRVQLDLEILDENELVPRTSEQARLLGVDFFSVFSRGSQFKVESLMFRIAKPENLLLPSPSRKQVGQQNALECLPLVMEPQSAFYTSPLLVLDFQSLYPSVMIAYNYCYSTFLGRVVNWRGQNKMGFTEYQRQHRLLELLKDSVNISPNGIIYTKPQIRKSLLAKMLGEILETRVMVKSGMKIDRDDKTLQRLLNNRQLALKLIANVTYGYTSASFSGRMPCSEIADSIVQTARETLEKAIALIHSVKRWGAEVVYGDTDSLFVYLKGRSKDEAFDIGTEIAKTVTNMNPRPIKLKFEKVYFPCVLLAKKRYVGFKYENQAQAKPDFDAKGIETVRRDGTPAEQKIEEKALKLLFRTADLSQVKSYFQRQCTKIMKGKVSIQDFCFAKEVKLGTYSNKGPPPPGALISTRRMLEDPRAEPQYGERVPYVVIAGAPGARLIDRCVAPDVLLNDEHSELDAEYYISKNIIPPLERIFNLMGANVRQWYDEMPKVQRVRRIEADLVQEANGALISKKTLESYMKSSSCVVCRRKSDDRQAICVDCMRHAEDSMLILQSRLNEEEEEKTNLERVCRSCSGLPFGEKVYCDSKDCPVYYTRTRHAASTRNAQDLTGHMLEVLRGTGEGQLHW